MFVAYGKGMSHRSFSWVALEIKIFMNGAQKWTIKSESKLMIGKVENRNQ